MCIFALDEALFYVSTHKHIVSNEGNNVLTMHALLLYKVVHQIPDISLGRQPMS